jgi:AP-4 complex subunit mu-1
MISQLHVLSPRGDAIISRDFRGELNSGTADVFFRKAKFWSGGAPPVFAVDGVNFFSVKKSNLYFVFVTTDDACPSFMIGLLNKLVKAFRDFCGILNEETLRRNFVLIYELIDEMIDYGFPQITAVESLKLSVHSDVVDPSAVPILFNPLSMIKSSNQSTVPSSAIQRPIGPVAQSHSNQVLTNVLNNIPEQLQRVLPQAVIDSAAGRGKEVKNEIFVDIIERIDLIMKNNEIINFNINGTIKMKSYLNFNSKLKISLNENLFILSDPLPSSAPLPGDVVLDDMTFSDICDLSEFNQNSKIINFISPDGEFNLINYRISNFNNSPPPLKIYLQNENNSNFILFIKSEIPETNFFQNLKISIPIQSEHVRSISLDPPGIGEILNNKFINFNIKKLNGNQEMYLKFKINWNISNLINSIGPINCSFEIPMYSVSGLQVKYLRISDGRSGGLSPGGAAAGPFRWVRYVTQSNSYQYRR